MGLSLSDTVLPGLLADHYQIQYFPEYWPITIRYSITRTTYWPITIKYYLLVLPGLLAYHYQILSISITRTIGLSLSDTIY